MPASVSEILDAASVIPVLTVHDVSTAAPLARALAAGGLKVIEMTMRTAQGVEALREMKAAVPELHVGMGTIRRPEQVAEAVAAGAGFLVSPGLTPALISPMLDSGVACLPGVGTISEAMSAIEAGFEALKFFPAEQAGGAPFLKSLAGPLPDIRFCPTGSISRELAPSYLKLPNVACVGGSWLATTAQIEAGDWEAISENARAAEAMKAAAG